MLQAQKGEQKNHVEKIDKGVIFEEKMMGVG